MTNKSPLFHLPSYVCALMAGAAAENIKFSDQSARKFWARGPAVRKVTSECPSGAYRVLASPSALWWVLSSEPSFCAESRLRNRASKEASTSVHDSDQPERPVAAKRAYWVCKCDPACLSSLSRRTACPYLLLLLF